MPFLSYSLFMRLKYGGRILLSNRRCGQTRRSERRTGEIVRRERRHPCDMPATPTSIPLTIRCYVIDDSKRNLFTLEFARQTSLSKHMKAHSEVGQWQANIVPTSLNESRIRMCKRVGCSNINTRMTPLQALSQRLDVLRPSTCYPLFSSGDRQGSIGYLISGRPASAESQLKL